jgi:peptidoglycan/xylan/chitin deacetylase (PgdA/CDA1 family)
MNPTSPQPLTKHGPVRLRTLAALVAALALVLTVIAGTTPAQGATRPQTVVSLTFDDGNADQLAAATTMKSRGMKGTFYVVSGFVGAAGYFTKADLTSLAAAGNEIGGHTVSHPDLTTIAVDEANRQICNDRAQLTSWGFQVRSFAYPFASTNDAVEAQAKACGYNSARMLGDIRSRFGCNGCSYAEKIPPADPYYTKALDQVDSTWTLQDLKNSVTNGERQGGWVQLTFHNVCASGCGDLNVTPTIFSQFLTWLQPRATSMNTVVKTVGDVVGGAVKPVVQGAVVPPAAPGVNGVKNPSLETAGTAGLPACWMQGGYGANTAAFSSVSPGRTGNIAEKLTVTGYTDGDAKVLPLFDLGQCSPSVAAGHTYSLRTWYTSTAVTQFAVYLRSATGAWQYWTSSPWFAASPSYTEAVWTSPAIPAGMTAISFGLNLFNNGDLTTDDYALYDSQGAPPASTDLPPAVPVAPKVSGPVEVHVQAPTGVTDDSPSQQPTQ